MRAIVPATIAALLAATVGASDAQAALSISDVGPVVPLPAGATGAAELSGLAWAGGSQYYAVADGGAGLFPVTIAIHPATGAITSATLSSKIQLSSGDDLEGIAFNSATSTVYVSDEAGPAIREYNLAGTQIGTVNVPSVYGNIRANFSLESLSRNASTMWTANEEALNGDGPASTTTSGSWVRLQKFDAGNAPAGQWAYQTDSLSGDSPFTTAERSGVSDVLALPDGRLLVLERELGGAILPDFRSRIYEVNFAGATDISAIPSLDSAASFTGVTKTLLWEGAFAADNFEGLTLGPPLANGDYSVLLISDDGAGSTAQSLYALRLTGVPEPTSALLAASFGLLLVQRRQRH